MIIRKEQLALMADGWERSRRAKLVLRLRQEFPAEIGIISDQELTKQVQDGLKAAHALAIVDFGHVYRFLRLRYLAPAIPKRLATEELIMRVLTDTAIEAGRRLHFIETSILANSCDPK